MLARFPGEAGEVLRAALEQCPEARAIPLGFQMQEDFRLKVSLDGFPCYIYLWKDFYVWEEPEEV